MMMNGCDTPNKENEKSCENERTQRRRKREEELYDMFYIFDKDRSGAISAAELKSVMMQFGDLSETEVNIMLKEADVDGDGQVV